MECERWLSKHLPCTGMREPRLFPWEERVCALGVFLMECLLQGSVLGPGQHNCLAGGTPTLAEKMIAHLLESSDCWFDSNRLRMNWDNTQRGYCALAAPHLPKKAVKNSLVSIFFFFWMTTLRSFLSFASIYTRIFWLFCLYCRNLSDREIQYFMVMAYQY